MGHAFVRVISFDLALNLIGRAEYCCVTGNLTYGLLPKFREQRKTDDEHFDLERLAHILKFVKACVDPQTLVILEDFAFARPNQAHQVGGLGFLVRFWLWQNKITFLTVAPGALKKFVSGKGNAPKAVMIKSVFKAFNIDEDDDNVADAIGLNFLGRSLIDEYEPRYVHQHAVVADLKKKYGGRLNVGTKS